MEEEVKAEAPETVEEALVGSDTAPEEVIEVPSAEEPAPAEPEAA